MTTIKKNQICSICGNRFTITEGLFLRDLSDSLKEQVMQTNKYAKDSSFICLKDMQILRIEKMQKTIDQDLNIEHQMNDRFKKKLSKDTYIIKNINDTLFMQKELAVKKWPMV